MTVLHGIAYCDSIPCSMKDEVPKTEETEMKIRSDFVTNSSSSSFVLAFKDEDAFKKFAEKCVDFRYKKLFKLVKRLIELGEENISKERALGILHGFYEHEFADEILDKLMLADTGNVDNDWQKRWALRESEAYKNAVEEKLAETDYPKKKKEIEESEFVVSGMVWDSDGGLLEWAIRNGFLESEFREVCKVCWNVG